MSGNFPRQAQTVLDWKTAAARGIAKLSDWFGRRSVLGGRDTGIPRTALFRVHSPSQSCAHFPAEGVAESRSLWQEEMELWFASCTPSS